MRQDSSPNLIDDSSHILKLEMYRLRLLSLVQDWHLLTAGVAPDIAAQQWVDKVRETERLFSRVGEGVAPSDWRTFSKLCADGSPVEWCERISGDREIPGPAYTLDPAPYGATTCQRLRIATEAAEVLLAHEGLDITLLRDILQILSKSSAPLPGQTISKFSSAADGHSQPDETTEPSGVAGLWLGVEERAERPRLIKLYINLNWRQMPTPWAQLSRALIRAGCPPDSLTEWLIKPLGQQGYPRMLALGLSADARPAAKLYYRLHQLDRNRLFMLTDAVSWPRQPFEDYLKYVLKNNLLWNDRNTGIGLGLRGEAGLTSLSLFHYASAYFCNDAELRHTILSAAPEFRWQTEGFRLSSRLIDAPDGQGGQNNPEEQGEQQRLRSLLGFSVHANGHTGLRIYSRTGYLAGVSS